MLRYIGYFNPSKGKIYKINNFVVSSIFSLGLIYSIYSNFGSMRNFFSALFLYPTKIFLELSSNFTELFSLIIFTIFLPIRYRMVRVFYGENKLNIFSLSFLLESVLSFLMFDLIFRLIVFFFLKQLFLKFLEILYYPFFFEKTNEIIINFLNNFLSFSSIFRGFILFLSFSFFLSFYSKREFSLFRIIAITLILSFLVTITLVIYTFLVSILINFAGVGYILTIYIIIFLYIIYIFFTLLKL